MKKNIYEIASLIKKSLVEELSEEETHQLENLLEDKSLHQLYEELNDRSFVQQQLAEYDRYSGKKAYQQFLEQIGSGEAKKRKRKLFYIFSIAAVIILLIIGFIYIQKPLTIQTEAQHILEETEKIITAGGKKAQLVLADGSVVNVDNDDVSVKDKNGVNIKYSKGEVTYELSEKPQELVYNQLIVPRGGETQITLEDGTRVWINAGSKLKYPVAFVGNDRKVFLEGEAYFEVSEDKNKLFIVNTKHGDIHVLGTSFGVNAYITESVSYTTLVEGKINFKAQNSPAVDLKPGEQIVVGENGRMYKRNVNVEEYIGWKNGIYSFRRKALKDIMKTFELWYDITVEYDDATIQNILFTGHLKRYDNINIFLKALSRTGDVRYYTDGNKITLYK